MRSSTIPWYFALLVLLAPNSASSDNNPPFQKPSTRDNRRPFFLLKRQDCLSGYNSCSGLGAGNACCASNTTCVLDQVGHVACCPVNAVCTGTINGIFPTTTSGPTGSNTKSAALTTLGSGLVATITTVTAGGSNGGGSTVPNGQYSLFAYVPTSYANAASCSSAWSYCQAESTSCFASLGGATNGVTVSGANGGVTVQGATDTMNTASSICSALSTSAHCSMQLAQCSTYGTSGNTFVVGTGAGGPKVTACPGMLYAMGAGAVVGAAGAMV